MGAFATLAELAERWPKAASMPAASAMLADASALVSAELARAGVAVDPDDAVQAANLRSVVCQMVHRSLYPDESRYGVVQQSVTAGPYTGSVTMSNPDGDLYLKDRERDLLGIRRMRVGAISPRIGDC